MPDHHEDPSTAHPTPSTPHAEPGAAAQEAAHQGGAAREWHVLVGVTGKCLKTAEVKELYEARKAMIRGPYTWEEIAKYRSSGMIKDDSILHKKGDLEWIPFEKHAPHLPGAEVAGAEEDQDAVEWYVLDGLAGKILETAYVKELYDKGQVKIRGPYSKRDLLKYLKEELINNNTMVYKKGERDWKPLSRYDVKPIQEAIKTVIFEGDAAAEISYRNSRLKNGIEYLSGNKKALAALVLLMIIVVAAWPYYYYSPDKIYGRIKKSVVMVMCDDIDRKQSSLGSGFIIDDSGLVVTNLHVIEKAANVRVKSGDDVNYQVVGVVMIDPKNDVAVLKIAKGNHELVSIERGDCDKLSVGERVYTIGNPGGMEFSLSEGLVSGKRKEDPVDKKARDLIQITAPISPGNSGGPVLDKRGRVIGIATLGSRNDFQNLNFAVPVKMVGNPADYKDIVVKFLPSNPKWKALATKQLAAADYGESSQIRLDCLDAFYNEESIARYGNNVRLWLKVSLSYQESTYNYSTFFRPQVISGYCLSEVDCKNKRYRYNIAFATRGPDKSAVNSNFDEENKWQSMTDSDKPQFDEICQQ